MAQVDFLCFAVSCLNIAKVHSLLRECVVLQLFEEPKDGMHSTIGHVGTIISGKVVLGNQLMIVASLCVDCTAGVRALLTFVSRNFGNNDHAPKCET